MRRQHLSVSLSPVPARINIQWCSEQSLKRDRIYPVHQIEMFQLKYCWDINSGIQYVPSLAYRSDVASEGNTVVLSLSGWGCKESWNAVINAVISLRRSLAYCTFQLNHCTFSSDHSNVLVCINSKNHTIILLVLSIRCVHTWKATWLKY